MSERLPVPKTIRRIAARRVFRSPRGRRVVLTIGVPQPVPGWAWGCALQITGLKTDATFRRPKYVLGIDGLQALHLAMKCAALLLELERPRLAWLGTKGDLGMPRFLPSLLDAQAERRLEAVAEREAMKFWRRARHASKSKRRLQKRATFGGRAGRQAQGRRA